MRKLIVSILLLLFMLSSPFVGSAPTAQAAAKYKITYTRAGTGQGTVFFTPAGTLARCKANCVNYYNAGKTVTLKAVPKAGSVFSGWSGTGGCRGKRTCTLTMSKARAVTARFTKITYAVTYSKVGAGSGTVSFTPAGTLSSCAVSCTNTYGSGTTVTMSAAPASGSNFAGWSGACSGLSSCVVTMSAAKSVSANFGIAASPPPPNYSVSYSKAGTGNGTVTFSPAGSASSCTGNCTNSYSAGTTVTLSAAPTTPTSVSKLAVTPSSGQLTPVSELMATADRNGSARVIVHLKSGMTAKQLQSTLQSRSARQTAALQNKANVDLVLRTVASTTLDQKNLRVRRFEVLPAFAADLNSAAIAKLAANPAVDSIEIDNIAQRFLDTSLPLIGMPAAKAGGATGSGRIVAVIDDGVLASHPFIGQARVIGEACFLASSACPNGLTVQYGTGAAAPRGTNTHGTHVAGIAMGYRNPGTNPKEGVASAANLIAADVFDETGGAYTSDIYAALEWIIFLKVSNPALPLDAVNMSLGVSYAYDADCDADYTYYKSLFDQLRSLGVIPVVAAGNNSWTSNMSVPACVSSAFSVASSKKTKNEYAYYSNISLATDVVAPGGDVRDDGGIVSSVAYADCDGVPNSVYCAFQGTSMAAPHVAGAITALRTAVPAASVAQIEAALKVTGVAMEDTRAGGTYTKPRIQVDSALAALRASVVSAFGGWSGDCSGSGTTCVLSMTSPRSVSATFNALPPSAEPTYRLGVSVGGDGSGTITSDVAGVNCGSTCSATYPNGTEVTLTAVEGGTSSFTSWSGCDYTNGLTCTVLMSAGRSVVAKFGSLSCPGLGCAMDSNLNWTTFYTSTPFYSQGTYLSGLSGDTAARSGASTDSNYTCMDTQIALPGDLEIVWSPSSEPVYDEMVMFVDGYKQVGYSGAGAYNGIWLNEIYSFGGTGTVSLAICYVKDGTVSEYLDASFVDKAVYTYTGVLSQAAAKSGKQVAAKSGKQAAAKASKVTVTKTKSRMVDKLGRPISPANNALHVYDPSAKPKSGLKKKRK